jgi:hypothetical protein
MDKEKENAWTEREGEEEKLNDRKLKNINNNSKLSTMRRNIIMIEGLKEQKENSTTEA